MPPQRQAADTVPMARRRRKNLTRLGNWLSLALMLGAIGSVTFVYWRWAWREQRWNKLIEEIAPKYGVSKFLVKAVMRQESGFDPFAYSSTGAIGLMQVMDAAGWDWARANRRTDFGRDSLWTPRVNIEAGTWYLARGLAYWRSQGVDDPLPFALAEYNAGRGPVLRWQASTAAAFETRITNAGVRRYVRKATEYYEYYRSRRRL